jgi:hypothetical protein
MLVHPWDAAQSDAECKSRLAPRDFGTLVASGCDRPVPVVGPRHFVYDGDATVLLHLARPDPVPRVQLAHFEPGSAVADPAVHRRTLPGIRGLHLTVDAAAAKFKYGGKLDEAHRAQVARLPRAAPPRRSPAPG